MTETVYHAVIAVRGARVDLEVVRPEVAQPLSQRRKHILTPSPQSAQRGTG